VVLRKRLRIFLFGFILEFAQVFDDTRTASWLTCDACISAMQN
jgi:hypothetical protein